MKKKLVVGMLALTLTLSACASATIDELENTETLEAEKAEGSGVSSNVNLEWTEEKMKDFWDDVETGGGVFEDLTDGYGSGVEIVITPMP